MSATVFASVASARYAGSVMTTFGKRRLRADRTLILSAFAVRAGERRTLLTCDKDESGPFEIGTDHASGTEDRVAQDRARRHQAILHHHDTLDDRSSLDACVGSEDRRAQVGGSFRPRPEQRVAESPADRLRGRPSGKDVPVRLQVSIGRPDVEPVGRRREPEYGRGAVDE